MTEQDQTVIKNLLQYMTDKLLIGSKQFNEAREHFGITTTYQGEIGGSHFVDVFEPNGQCSRHTFIQKSTADEFAGIQRG